MRVPDGVGLRIHRLPYLSYRVNAKGLSYATDCSLIVKKELPNVRAGRVRQAKDRVLACLAFADTYSLEDQFMEMGAMDFIGFRPFDFQIGEETYYVIPSRVDERHDNIGPKTQFRVQNRVLKDSSADCFVAAAISLPTIHLLGWVTRDEMSKHIQGWWAILYAGSPGLRPMDTLPAESRRKKGYYV